MWVSYHVYYTIFDCLSRLPHSNLDVTINEYVIVMACHVKIVIIMTISFFLSWWYCWKRECLERHKQEKWWPMNDSHIWLTIFSLTLWPLTLWLFDLSLTLVMSWSQLRILSPSWLIYYWPHSHWFFDPRLFDLSLTLVMSWSQLRILSSHHDVV